MTCIFSVLKGGQKLLVFLDRHWAILILIVFLRALAWATVLWTRHNISFFFCCVSTVDMTLTAFLLFLALCFENAQIVFPNSCVCQALQPKNSRNSYQHKFLWFAKARCAEKFMMPLHTESSTPTFEYTFTRLTRLRDHRSFFTRVWRGVFFFEKWPRH